MIYFRCRNRANMFSLQNEGFIAVSEDEYQQGYPVSPPDYKYLANKHSERILGKEERMVGWTPGNETFSKVLLDE